MKENSELGISHVFSDHVQMFDDKLNVTEFVVMITAKFVYLFDCKTYETKRLETVAGLNKLVLMKTNPSAFQIHFAHQQPLLL